MASSFGISAAGVDAMNVAGQFYTAICCADGVDIVNCDEKRHVQSLRDCVGALHAVWSLRTLHLAVFLKDCAYIYSCSTSPAALTPMWVKTKSIFFSNVEDVNELVSSVSFRYPEVLLVQNEEARLINCRSGSNLKIEPPLERASLAQLSYTGVVVAICSPGSRRIDFMEVKGNGCLHISKKEHSNEVSFLAWRPGYASERELLLASDVSNLVRIFAVDFRQSFDKSDGRTSYAEAHLLIELGDFVGKPAVFSWLQHGISTAAETSFLHDHFAKGDKEPAKVWKAHASTSDWNQPHNSGGGAAPNAVFSTQNHTTTSGSWLTVLDDRGVLRLLCISPVGVTGHMQCILRGRGPVLRDMPESLPICGVFVSGRFQPNGAEKPVAIECVYVFRLNSVDNNSIGTFKGHGAQSGVVAGSYAFGGSSETASNYERADGVGPVRRGTLGRRGSGTGAAGSESSNELGHSRRLVRLVSVFTTGPADDFISVAQNDKEFTVPDYHPGHSTGQVAGLQIAGDLRKRIADFMLPSSSQSGWRLETWETYALGGGNDKGVIVPKSFRALSSPWVGTEAALWCYAHRHKNRSHQAEVVGSLASLHFQPIDVTTAGMGFELTHDILRALWLAAPQQSPPSAGEVHSAGRKPRGNSGSCIHTTTEESGDTGEHAAKYSANVPILVTLQQKQLGSFVVAIWAIQQSTSGGGVYDSGPAADCTPVFGGQLDDMSTSASGPKSDGVFKMGLKRNESKNKYNSDGPSLSVGISGGVDYYEVSITPDPHFGLGLRLDVSDGVVVVESFKRNPLTMKMMPAEESGIIGVGDELLSVNSNELKGHSLSDVIQIIRIVVQNARGSSVVLKLRGKNKVKKSGGGNGDVMSEDAADRLRVVSTAVHASQPGWYYRQSENDRQEADDDAEDGATEGQGGYYDPNSAGRHIPDEELRAEAAAKQSWQLELSHAFDDCVAVDIVLGGYGEALSRGDLWTASSGDILAICVALRRVHGVEGSELELSVHEVVYDLAVQSVNHKFPRRRHSSHAIDPSNPDQNDDQPEELPCRYKIVHVGSIPWLGHTPYALQVWRTGGLSFLVSTSTQGGVMTMCTIECLRTWDNHRKEAWTCPSDEGDEVETAGGTSSYNCAAVDNKDWLISNSFCLKLSVDTMRLRENHDSSSRENRQAEFIRRGKSSDHLVDPVVSAAMVEQAQWVPICCPFLSGRRAVVLGIPGGSTIMLAVARSANGSPIGPVSGAPDIVGGGVAGVPLSRRVAVANAIKTASILECVQVISVSGTVKWAQWLEGYTFQVSTGSSWILFSRQQKIPPPLKDETVAANNDPNEIDVGSTVICSNNVTDSWAWEERVSAPFGCTDKPNTMSTNSVEQPSSILCGTVLSAPSSEKRGLLPPVAPDWHPLCIAFKLFEHPRSVKAGNMSGVKASLRLLSALAMSNDVTASECFDTIVSSLTAERYPELFTMESAAGLDLGVPVCSAEMIEMLVMSISSTAKGIALANVRKQNNSQLGNLAMNMLPVPFRTMSPVDILLMAAEASAALDVIGEGKEKIDGEGTLNERPVESADSYISARFESLDVWARNAIMANKCVCAIDALKAKPKAVVSDAADSEVAAGGYQGPAPETKAASDISSYTSDDSVRITAAFVANAVISSSQKELYDEFIGDCARKLCDQSHETPDVKTRSKLHFGMLWWARNSVGQDAVDGEYDILKSLTAIMAPLWLHDFTPLVSLIETVATQQFKYHRDSMKVFLEMVLIGKTDKLMLLAKTDKNIMGKQLKSLLSIDFASEKGRNSLHKNAFALLRLQRYKHAAAVFLCAEPPMLREAVRVIVKHLNDPFLALLVTRVIEHRRACLISTDDDSTKATFLGHPGGHMLGPVSRQLLETEIVPGLYSAMKQKKTDQLPAAVMTRSWGIWGGEAALLLGVCGHWLQDVSVFSKLTLLGRRCGYFTPAISCSSVGKAKQMILVSSSWHWLVRNVRQFGRSEDIEDIAFELDGLFDQLGLADLRLLCRELLDENQNGPQGSNSFVAYSEKCLKDWKSNKHKRVAAIKATKLAMAETRNRESAHKQALTTTHTSPGADQEQDDEFDQALSKLNKLKNSTKIDNTIAVDEFSSAPKKGFNLASMTSSASSSQQSAPSMLDAFDVPPVARKQRVEAAADPPSMLDMYAPPPQRAKPTAAAPPSMLDGFDAAPRPKPRPAEPASALDMFNMPSPPAKKAVAAASMLDMYDAPPPQSKPKPKPAAEPPNALDMFSMPPQPVKQKSVSSAPASMLDMYDAPPLIKVKHLSALDSFDSSSRQGTPSSLVSTPVSVCVDDDEDVVAISKEEQAVSIKIFHDAHRSVTARKAHHLSEEANIGTTGEVQAGCCDALVHIASEYLFEARCISELIKVIGCPTMGHPWAVSGNIRSLVDIAISACTKGKGDEKIRLMAFRCCLNELANKYAPILMNDVRVAREVIKMRKNSSGETDTANEIKPVLRYILCARLLEYLELRKSIDCVAVRVLLCWAAGRAEEARRVLLGCVIAVFEASPQCADFSDICDAPVLRLARQSFMLCMAANLEIILTMNVAPVTTDQFVPACRMSPGLAAVVAIAVRAALMFGCVDHRYDILLKLLKHPPKFRMAVDTSTATTTPSKSKASTDKQKIPSGQKGEESSQIRDQGYHYLKRVSRAEAIALLQGHAAGTFLIRPHDTQSEVLFLSFLSSAEEGVKHAIIRREVFSAGNEDGILEEPDTGRRHHQYRCGKIGPCKTLDETLKNISLILPCRLLLTEDVSDIVTGEGIGKDSKEERGSDETNARPADGDTNQGGDGGFVSRVDRSFHNVKHTPAMSLLDISWNPNAEFWWESVHHSRDDKGKGGSMKEINPEESRQSMLAAMHAGYLSPNQIDDYAGRDTETHIAERNREEFVQNIIITRDDQRGNHDEDNIVVEEDGEEGQAAVKHESSITVALNRRENRRSNEDRGWGSPMRHQNIGGLIRGVIQLLTVKTLYKQLCGQMDSIRKSLSTNSADKVLDTELRTLILLKLANRLPVTMLPKDGPGSAPAGSMDSSDHSTSYGGFVGIDSSKHSTMHSADGVPLSSVDYLLFPLALFGCVSERAMMSVLCPPLPLDPKSLTSPQLLAGEQLAQSMLSAKSGVPMNIAKIPHSALGSHLGFVVAHTSNSVSHAAQSVQDQVVECFDINDGVKWINEHVESDALNTVMCYISSMDAMANPDTIPDASATIKWLWKKGFLQNIVIGNGGSSHSNSQVFYRYVDPWEVSVVTDQTAVLASCRLGRLWLGPVSAYGASGLVEVVSTYLKDAHDRETVMLQLPGLGTGTFNSNVIDSAISQDSADSLGSLLAHAGDRGFLKLWETLRAEAWLVMCISSATDQPERETGGPDAFVEANVTGLSAHDPYHLCISRYLFRNALFKRVYLPHRFVAMIQIDTFVLKDLAPHKFKAGVVSAPIEVYGVLRLIRSGGGGGVKKSDALKKGSCDIVVTPSRRAETAKSASTSQPSEYLWREQAVLRFPLPESILSVDPFCDDDAKYLRQPPRKLQLSVYETRSLFGDQKLGDLELPLSALTDERPFREWLPLTSEKGSAWFIRIQLQLRFLLMAHDADRASDPESSTIRSKKGKVTGDKGSSGRGSLSVRPGHSSRETMDGSNGSKAGGSHRGSMAGREDVPAQSSTLDRFRATASVMYESALTEAASLGHAGSGTDSSTGRDNESPMPDAPAHTRRAASAPHTGSKDGGKESVLGELGDFF